MAGWLAGGGRSEVGDEGSLSTEGGSIGRVGPSRAEPTSRHVLNERAGGPIRSSSRALFSKRSPLLLVPAALACPPARARSCSGVWRGGSIAQAGRGAGREPGVTHDFNSKEEKKSKNRTPGGVPQLKISHIFEIFSIEGNDKNAFGTNSFRSRKKIDHTWNERGMNVQFFSTTFCATKGDRVAFVFHNKIHRI